MRPRCRPRRAGRQAAWAAETSGVGFGRLGRLGRFRGLRRFGRIQPFGHVDGVLGLIQRILGDEAVGFELVGVGVGPGAVGGDAGSHGRGLLQLGLHDGFRLHNDEAGTFSWWDYRAAGFRRNLGLRIDLTLVSDALKSGAVASGIDREPRVQMQVGHGSYETQIAGAVTKVDATDWPVPGTRWRSRRERPR